MKQLYFPFTHEASFVKRTRFRAYVYIWGKEIPVYFPNPGRLSEILLPGRRVYLLKEGSSFTLIGAERDGLPILLHPHYTNCVARFLLEEDLIPSLSGYRVKKREVKVGNGRLDLLAFGGGRELFLEVKSCTLFGREVALFPDAKSGRASRHLHLLLELSKNGRGAAMLFVVHSPRVCFFLPNYHVDLEFARSFFSVRDQILLKAVSVGWEVKNSALSLVPEVRELEIPWEILHAQSKDRGLYVLVLELENDTEEEIGARGKIHFRKGYYLYVGSSKNALEKRVQRHKRRRKRVFWHIDYLRRRAKILRDIMVRTEQLKECELAFMLGTLFKGVEGFGCSDCRCPSHLFYSKENPLQLEAFWRLMQDVQIDRLSHLLRNDSVVTFTAQSSPLF